MSPSAPEPRESLVEIGRVLRPHGARGEVRLQPLTDSPELFQRGRYVHILGRRYRIRQSRPHQGAFILHFQGVESPEGAEELRGALVEIPFDELSPLPEHTYYRFQIVGLRVHTTEGEALGEVADILHTGSNDVYVVRGPRGEVLVPAIGDVVRRIDLEAGFMEIEALPGLL